MLKIVFSYTFFIVIFLCDLLLAKEDLINQEEKHSSLPQLDYTKFLQEIFWFVVLFALLYFFVKKIFFVKIYEIKSVRNERISMYTSKILKIKKEIESINKKINLSLDQANNKANEIINNSIENVHKNTKDKILRNLENEKNKKQNMKNELVELQNTINGNANSEIFEISKSILEKMNIEFLDSDIKQAVNNVVDTSLDSKFLDSSFDNKGI